MRRAGLVSYDPPDIVVHTRAGAVNIGPVTEPEDVTSHKKDIAGTPRRKAVRAEALAFSDRKTV